MFRSITRLTVASALALTCSTAQAGLIKIGTADVEFARPIFGSTGKDTVKLNYLDRNNVQRSMRTNAGRFSGSATADGFDADIFYENADLVYLYCIDLYERIGSGWDVTYDVHTLDNNGPNTLEDDGHPVRNFDRTLTFLGALNYTLADEYGFETSNYNWLNPTSNWMSGAIQLGIWESLYERDTGEGLDSWDILGGNFNVSGSGKGSNALDRRGVDLLQKTFANIGDDDVSALGTQYALILTNSSKQDMIAGDPPVDVPAPATAFLLLGGVGLLRRGNRRTTAA